MKRTAQQALCCEEKLDGNGLPPRHIAIPGWEARDQLLQMSWGWLRALYPLMDERRRREERRLRSLGQG